MTAPTVGPLLDRLADLAAKASIANQKAIRAVTMDAKYKGSYIAGAEASRKALAEWRAVLVLRFQAGTWRELRKAECARCGYETWHDEVACTDCGEECCHWKVGNSRDEEGGMCAFHEAQAERGEQEIADHADKAWEYEWRRGRSDEAIDRAVARGRKP